MPERGRAETHARRRGAVPPPGVVLATAAATLLALVHPLPAGADPGGDSTVTITVEGGALELTVARAPTNLGSVEATGDGTTVRGALGKVSVTDKRNAAPGSTWVASVVATDFRAKEGSPIPAGRVSYTAGTIKGTGVATLRANDPKNLKHAQAAVTATDVAGNNTATWTPTVHVHIPPGLAPGVYTGTITHSVA